MDQKKLIEGVLKKKYSERALKRILNSTPLGKYIKIAMNSGFNEAKELLEADWRARLVRRSTYFRISKFLKELQRDVEEEMGQLEQPNYTELTLKLLRYATYNDSEPLTKNKIAEALNCDIETIDKLLNWMTRQGLGRTFNLILKGKNQGRLSQKQHQAKIMN